MATKEPNVNIFIPEDVALLLKDLGHDQSSDDNVKISLAIGLFVSKTVSLARAAEISNLSLNDFIYILQIKGVPWGEYTEETFIKDDLAIREYLKEIKKK